MHDYKCTCYLVKYQYIPTFDVMLIVFISVNVILSLISWWRCYANNYLHWGAYATWILLSIQGKIQYSFRNESCYFKCLPKYPESISRLRLWLIWTVHSPNPFLNIFSDIYTIYLSKLNDVTPKMCTQNLSDVACVSNDILTFF